MNELETKILNSITSTNEYRYSQDITVRAVEQQAVKNLADNGCIIIKTQSIGYVIAESS